MEKCNYSDALSRCRALAKSISSLHDRPSPNRPSIAFSELLRPVSLPGWINATENGALPDTLTTYTCLTNAMWKAVKRNVKHLNLRNTDEYARTIIDGALGALDSYVDEDGGTDLEW